METLLPSYEIWEWIKGYEGQYEISNRGRHRVWLKGGGNGKKLFFYNEPKIKKTFPNKWGYLGSAIGGKRLNNHKAIRIHREVAFIFTPNLENKAEVNHINGNKNCNEWWNFEWVNRVESIDHAFRTRLIVAAVGEQQANTKLTNEAVLLIYRHDAETKKIADGFGVSTHTVLDIKKGRTWWHITGHKRHIKPSEKGRFKLDPNESNS